MDAFHLFLVRAERSQSNQSNPKYKDPTSIVMEINQFFLFSSLLNSGWCMLNLLFSLLPSHEVYGGFKWDNKESKHLM